MGIHSKSIDDIEEVDVIVAGGKTFAPFRAIIYEPYQ